jgi:hypothetical protein
MNRHTIYFAFGKIILFKKFLFTNEIFSQIRADKNYKRTKRKKYESEKKALFWLKIKQNCDVREHFHVQIWNQHDMKI